MALPPLDDGTFHFGLKGTLGPIPLTGEKSGFDFQAEVEMDWLWQWNNGTQKTTAEVCLPHTNLYSRKSNYFQVQNYIDTDTFPQTFQNSAKFQVDYSSSTQGNIPIITLVDDVSSWEVGDQILVASTSFEVRESETFTIVECQECTANQVKLDRPATFTHWGRIDTDSGIIDQRAEVGLLSRNVRFYGEMSSNSCQYALTRESLDSNSPNNGVSWCRIGSIALFSSPPIPVLVFLRPS